jgi:hypothetical protein
LHRCAEHFAEIAISASIQAGGWRSIAAPRNRGNFRIACAAFPGEFTLEVHLIPADLPYRLPASAAASTCAAA